MRFSIVIPAFNEEMYIRATLEKITLTLGGIGTQFEVIVVNNASCDKTAEIAQRLGARVVDEPVHNIARVRNTGARAAGGDVLIFLDADTLVPDGLFARIADIMLDEKCFGGAVAVAYESFQRNWMKYYLFGWKFWGKVFNMKQGAAQFCRRPVFDNLQGYDENIFMGEDIEFYWRLSKFAKRHGGYLNFIEDLEVVTSARRFDKMGLWKTFFLTHPLFIWLNWKRKSVWKDWYEKAIR